jgi:hypothetical protein
MTIGPAATNCKATPAGLVAFLPQDWDGNSDGDHPNARIHDERYSFCLLSSEPNLATAANSHL